MTRAPLAATLALTVAAALGAVLVVAPIALLLVPENVPPEPFANHHQDAETLVFVLAFAVILPLSILFMPRFVDRIAAGPNSAGTSALAAVLTAALLGGLLLVKLSERLPWGGGSGVLLAAAALWSLLALASLRRAGGSRPWPMLERTTTWTKPIWAAAAALAVVLCFAFALLSSVDAAPFGIAALVAVLAFVLHHRGAIPRPPRPWGVGVDLLMVALVFVAVPNLVVLQPEDPSDSLKTTVIQFHQNFFLGPANHVVGGGVMLVDTLSQYGVGSIYLVAAWFELTSVTNGMIGLLEGLLAASVFAAAYLVLRIAGVGRLLAAAAMLVALIVLVWGIVYPIGGLLQQGAIRFGMPMAVILAAVIGVGRPRWATPTRIAVAATVGLSAVWALEAFAYTLLTAAATIAMLAWLEPTGGRRRWLALRGAEVVAACVVAHLLLAAITLAAAGELPDWTLYLATLHAFLIGDVGDLTYDFSRWSPGFGLGAMYLASATAIVLVMRREAEFARAHAVELVGLAGATAYGVALLSYLVNRSLDSLIPYVSLPAVLVSALWLSLLLRSPEVIPLRLRQTSLAIALTVSVLLVATAWSSVPDRFSQSALAHLAPGGKSTGAALDRLEDFPPISPGAEEAEDLLTTHLPGESESLVVLDPDLGIEILARTGRINALPLSDPWEETLVPDEHVDALGETVDGLVPGDRMMLSRDGREWFATFRVDPSLDPLQIGVTKDLVPLQLWVLDRIAERFRLRTVARGDGPAGLVVVELVAAER